NERHGGVHVGAEGADGRDYEFIGSFDLGAIGFAGPEFRRIDHGAENFSDIVVEFELRIFAGLFDGPAGEAAGDFGDVLLGVAAIHAEGVKFHQFAAVIFVEATLRLFVLRLLLGPRGIVVRPTAHLLAGGAFGSQAGGCIGIGA